KIVIGLLERRRRLQFYRAVHLEFSGDDRAKRDEVRERVLLAGGARQLQRKRSIQRVPVGSAAGRQSAAWPAFRVFWLWRQRPHSSQYFPVIRIHTQNRI